MNTSTSIFTRMGDVAALNEVAPSSKLREWQGLVEGPHAKGQRGMEELGGRADSQLTRHDCLTLALPSVIVVLVSVIVPIIYAKLDATRFFVVTGGVSGAAIRALQDTPLAPALAQADSLEFQTVPMLAALIALIIVIVNHLASFSLLSPLQLRV
jgi:hypothetical protein